MSSNPEIETKPQPPKPKKKENLKQRAYLNSVTSVLDYGARLITGFVVTPFLVSGLGSTMYGVWKVIEQFTAYTNIADLKPTVVLKWAVSRDREKLSEKELREYVTITFLILSVILPLLLIIGAIIAWYSPQITGVSNDYYGIVRIATLILVLSLLTNKVFSIYSSILTGMNLNFKGMGIRAAIIIVGGGMEILVIQMGFGLIGLAAVQVIIALILGIIIYVIVKKHVSWYGFEKVGFKKSISFIKTSGWFMSWSGVEMVLFNSDKILLGYLISPIIVSQYVLTQYTIRAGQGLVTNFARGVIPGIGKLFGNDEQEKFLVAREHLIVITWFFAINIGSLVILFNESFISLWVGNEHFTGRITNLLILLVAVQHLFIRNESSFIKISLDIRHKVLLGLLSAFLSISLIFILTPKFGIAGLCVAFILGRTVMTFGYPAILQKKLSGYYLNKSMKWRLIISTILIWSPLFIMSGHIKINSWMNLISFSVLTTLIIGFISFYLGITESQRKQIFKSIKGIKLF